MIAHRLRDTMMGALVLVGAMLPLAPPSMAASGDAEAKTAARAYFDAGESAYEAGDFVVAIRAFGEALRLYPNAAIVFSLAQSHRQQYFVDHDRVHLARAIALFRRYVTEVPRGGRRRHAVQHLSELEPLWVMVKAAEIQPKRPQPAPTQLMVFSAVTGARARIGPEGPLEPLPLVQTVQAGQHTVYVEANGCFPNEIRAVAVAKRLVVLEVQPKPMPATVTVETAEGATVTVDGRQVGTAPLVGPLEIPQGDHRLAIRRNGRYPFMTDLALSPGESRAISAPLGTTRQRRIAQGLLVSAAIGLATASTTAYFAWDAQSDAQAILDQRERSGSLAASDVDRYHDRRDRRDELVRVSTLVLATAIVAALTGTGLHIFDEPTRELHHRETPQSASNNAEPAEPR